MTKVLLQQWQAFCIAMQFLTQMPIRLRVFPEPRIQGQSLLYYPLVGVIIGAGLALIAWLLDSQSGYIPAALVLVIWVVVTGGLHLDGLSDSADGWMGGLGDPKRTLLIMKDPCIGAIGTLALILVLMLKWSALMSLLTTGELLPVVIAPAIARLAAVFLLAITPYVREQGIASQMLPEMPRKGIYRLTALAAIGLAWFNLAWFLVVVLFFWIARRAMLSRIKGTTGDTAGALIELLETAVLLAATCFALEI